jgi:hypothetical protein
MQPTSSHSIIPGGVFFVDACKTYLHYKCVIFDMPLECDKFADIVVVQGNSLNDITLEKNVLFVMKE